MRTEADMKYADMEEAVKQGRTCPDCGAVLQVAWGGSIGHNCYILRCPKNIEHSGIAREVHINPYDLPEWNLGHVTKGRIKRMTQEIGEEKTKALAKFSGKVSLTEPELKQIFAIINPEAPPNDILKVAIICRDYGLHPLMNHIHLVGPYNTKVKTPDGEKWVQKWAIIMGIKATRLMAARKKSFSYIDDTPRVMTEDEQTRKFGKVFDDRLAIISKLKDLDGNEASGIGFYLHSEKDPKGTDKGNTRFNMASIRSERQAIDKLVPDTIPAEIEVVDENYFKVDVIEGEATPIPEKATTRGVDPETGEIKEAEGTTEEAQTEEPPPEAGEEAPEPTPPEFKIDMEWLHGELGMLEIKPDILSAWIAQTFRVEAQTELEDTLKQLTKPQQEQFVKQVEAGLKALRKTANSK